nr:hypothetical protein FD201807_087R [Megalocytivirus FD201807]
MNKTHVCKRSLYVSLFAIMKMDLLHLAYSIYNGIVGAVAPAKPRVSHGERECHRAIEAITGKKFAKSRCIKNPVTGQHLELDCYNSALKLAVEYNGRQHYQYVPHFHGPERHRFTEQRYKDVIKAQLCKEQGIKLIVVPYTVPVDDIEAYIRRHV